MLLCTTTQVVRSAFGRLHLPGSTILRWLDSHVQLRLSILLTYLFGKSVYFAQLMRWAGGMLRYLRVVAQPALVLLGELDELCSVSAGRCHCERAELAIPTMPNSRLCLHAYATE